MKAKTIKLLILLEENIMYKFSNTGWENGFLYLTPKVQATDEKN